MILSSEEIAKILKATDVSEVFRNIVIIESNTKYENVDEIAISAEKKLMKDITELLKKFGVPVNLKGFEYLRYGIMLRCLYPRSNFTITKELYPKIAQKYETIPSRVERACTHAIEAIFIRGKQEECYKIFGNTLNINKGKTVNSEFIATIADYIIRKELEEFLQNIKIEEIMTISGEEEIIVEVTTIKNMKKLVDVITELFKDLGISANLKGFEYLRYCVMLRCLYPEDYSENITELYNEVARKYEITPNRVERSCRHAIEIGFARGNLKNYYEIFGNTLDINKGKPVNSEFIATLVDYIIHNKMEENYIVKINPSLGNDVETENNVAISSKKKKLINDITKLFKCLGIPANLKGFEYLRYGVMLRCLYLENDLAFTKTLYPEIAKKYSTTPSRVDKSCRHAIEIGFARGNSKTYYEIFGNTLDVNKKKITNSRFFATVADYIMSKESIHFL